MVLHELCNKYGLDMDRVVKALVAASIKVDPEKTLKEIADANGSDPHALFEILSDAANAP